MKVQRGSLDADIGVVGAGPAGSLLAIGPAGTPGLGWSGPKARRRELLRRGQPQRPGLI
jgi:hypothetical protein